MQPAIGYISTRKHVDYDNDAVDEHRKIMEVALSGDLMHSAIAEFSNSQGSREK